MSVSIFGLASYSLLDVWRLCSFIDEVKISIKSLFSDVLSVLNKPFSNPLRPMDDGSYLQRNRIRKEISPQRPAAVAANMSAWGCVFRPVMNWWSIKQLSCCWPISWDQLQNPTTLGWIKRYKKLKKTFITVWRDIISVLCKVKADLLASLYYLTSQLQHAYNITSHVRYFKWYKLRNKWMEMSTLLTPVV